jgi:TrkA domain protein
MARIEKTRLPGIGVRHDFTTSFGTRVGMLTYDSGERELLVFDDRDPDEPHTTLRLSDDDAHALADLLGGAQVIDVDHASGA